MRHKVFTTHLEVSWTMAIGEASLGKRTMGWSYDSLGKDEQERTKTGGQGTLNRNNPLTISPKFRTLDKSADNESIAFGTSSFQSWKYVLGLVVLSFVVSVVAAILASVALNNSSERSVADEKLLPAKQNLLTLNSSGTFVCCPGRRTGRDCHTESRDAPVCFNAGNPHTHTHRTRMDGRMRARACAHTHTHTQCLLLLT